MSSRPGRRLKTDVVVSTTFAFVRVVLLLWLVRAAGESLAPALLGVFLLSRRIASTVANLLQLGASQTLRRYISIHSASPTDKFAYFGTALAGLVVLASIVLPISYWIREELGSWLYPGLTGSSSLAFWTIANALAIVFSFFIFSSFIAERWIALGNSIDVLASGGILVLVLLFQLGEISPTQLMRVQTLGTAVVLIVAAFGYTFVLRRSGTPSRAALDAAQHNFIGYGLPRTLVPFGDMLLLLIGPWLLRADPAQAGYLVVALTLTRAVQSLIQPLAQVGSVIAARLSSGENEETLGLGIKLLFGTALYGSVFVVVIIAPWRDLLLQVWLGEQRLVDGVRYYFDVLMWAIIPFAVFQGLKGVIEMRWFRPLNLYSLTLASALYVSVYLALEHTLGASQAVRVATLVAFLVLGACTLYWSRQYLSPVHYWGMPRLLVISALLGVFNTVAASGGGILRFGAVTTVSAVLAVVCVNLRPALYVETLRAFALPSARFSNLPGRRAAR